ncbi:MAG: tRNA epoxyqueuosine(34) reductase QueG [Vulcanimicrobiaceae bacterium]
MPTTAVGSAQDDLSALKARLASRALELGAVELRVTAARVDDEARARMRASFARGDLETWGYGDRYADAATDPSALLNDARRVVCIAVPYRTAPPPRQPPLSGRVSNYAWSRDYHHRVRALLEELVGILNAHAGSAVARAVCDTAPLAERAHAARAGLGWVGKHTNLISPAGGSYVFLGEVVTSLDLPVDAPLRKTCGSCTRCVSGCPTGALRGDYTIDARRCIADLTQRTDQIPRELRPYLGDWVWGCDICQIVCPPNEQAAAGGSADFAAVDEALAAPDLVALLQLKSGEFKRRYKPTAMGWRGAAVLRRNAAIALGNRLDRGAVPPLLAALQGDPHPMVREACAWALGRIASPQAISGLRASAETEEETSVREEIDAALEHV